MKRFIFAMTFLALSAALFADGVSFTASAPTAVPNGQTFQLVYTVNAKGKDLRVPDFAGFDVVVGPYSSTSSSVSFINGHKSSETIVRYTYTLLPTKGAKAPLLSRSRFVSEFPYKT